MPVWNLHEDMVLCKYVGYSAGVASVECTRCETRYRVSKATGRILCNDKAYTDCPYCIADHLKALHDENKELINQALF